MLKTITAANLGELAGKARESARLRAHLNVHDSLQANVQRLVIATEPGTDMRPHRHPEAHKWEFFLVIRGEIHLLVFADDGRLLQRIPMTPDGTQAVEIPAGVYHAYVCMRAGTIALEVKEGAYIPTAPGDFADWSPAENSPEAAAYLEKLRAARVAAA